jgi:hypothetical protein
MVYWVVKEFTRTARAIVSTSLAWGLALITIAMIVNYPRSFFCSDTLLIGISDSSIGIPSEHGEVIVFFLPDRGARRIL